MLKFDTGNPFYIFLSEPDLNYTFLSSFIDISFLENNNKALLLLFIK